MENSLRTYLRMIGIMGLFMGMGINSYSSPYRRKALAKNRQVERRLSEVKKKNTRT